MKLPWWMKSWTVWAGAIAIAMCYVPVVRDVLHQAGLALIAFQGAIHILLRFKTEYRETKLSLHQLEGTRS